MSSAHFRLATLLLVVALVTACSSRGQPAGGLPPRKIRIAVLPVEVAVDIGSLRELLTLPEGAQIPDEPARIRDRLARVAQVMTRKITDRLAATGHYEVVPVPDGDEIAREKDGLPNPDGLKHLGLALGVDAVLYVRLSGYGQLNKKWTTGIVASGSAEAVGEGTLVWLAIGNVTVAVAVMLEEGIRDTLMAVGGLSAFNAGYTPVTLDALVFDSADGREPWSHTAFATTDSKMLEKVPKNEQEKREVRLEATGGKAVLDLTDNLDKAAETDLGSLRMQPSHAKQ